MFKVPDWGNDIPKSDVEVMKLFTKTNKRKHANSNNHPKIKDKVTKKVINHKKKDVNAFLKVKNKVNGHIKLSKDDHINNRILRRQLKTTTSKTTNNGTTNAKNNNSKNKVKNKILKTKGMVSKDVSNNKNSEIKQSNNTNQKKSSFRNINHIDMEPKLLKRKPQDHKKHDDMEMNNADLHSLNTDEPDKILVNAKRKKLNDKIKNDDVEDVLFGNKDKNEEVLSKEYDAISNNKIYKKKEKLKRILERDSNRNIIRSSSNKLRERMLERLKAAQFRYLNEKLYTSSGIESQELFKSDPTAFHTYHEGYQLQVKKWPVNPLDMIVKRIQKMPKTHLIADMGCGEAALSKRVAQSVRSFDLVATTPNVETCNMAHTPLLAASMDAVVYCLALMGTDLTQYLLEANRVLKIGGYLLIAEVESRFENVDLFSSDVQRLGFSLKKLDKSHQVFFFMEFSKVRDAPAKKGKLPSLNLKPCLYKRR